MKKVLCMLVLAAVSAAHAMMTPPPTPAQMPMPDMTQMAAAHFQTTAPAMPEQHPTMQAMRNMDAQCMVHPEVAAKHMKMMHEAYAAGHMNGHQTGMKQAGQYMQSCLNSMASTMTPAKTK